MLELIYFKDYQTKYQLCGTSLYLEKNICFNANVRI